MQNNILTDAAMATLSDLWVQLQDAQGDKRIAGPQAAAHWSSIANACTAYAAQHSLADMVDEANAFEWLGEVALVHAQEEAASPRLAVVRNMDEALRR